MHLNITDSNYPLAVESKQKILSYGISEDYFNKHFRFLCGSQNEVVWQYTIGEFTIISDDNTVSIPGKHIIRGIEEFRQLEEVQSVISKNEAEQKMQSCLGDFNGARTIFDSFPKKMSQMDENVPTRPYFTAHSVHKSYGSLGSSWDIGYVDLVTSECIKREGGSSIDCDNSNSLITDSNDPLVVESKQKILSLGISEDYFNKHFQFSCASQKQVIWQYIMGEFRIILTDDIPGKDMHYIKTLDGVNLSRLNEIQSVISQNEAEQKMRLCIEEFMDPRVEFFSLRPYFTATLPQEWMGSVHSGYIDLITGECTKREFTPHYRSR